MLALNRKSYQAINRNSINLIKITETVYYLTGRGGQLKSGVGNGVLDRGVSLAGRAMSGPFERLEFQGQIDLISQDLQESFWQEDSKLIAVSYGAYLLLHALSDKPPFLGSILLLSPVMGGGDYRACT